MKNTGIVILCMLLVACSRPGKPEGFERIIGKLWFDKTQIDWGQVCLGRIYQESIKIYNPLKRSVSFKIGLQDTLFHVYKLGVNPLNLEQGMQIPARTTDSLIFVFRPAPDTALIGSYFQNIHIEVDGEIYMSPLVMLAQCIENFDGLDPAVRKSAPSLKLKQYEYNFDTIPAGKQVHWTVPLKNTGQYPLIIRRIESSCGCTAAVPEQKVIRPGTSVDLNITFNPVGRTGLQKKTITLYCNDPVRPVTELTVKGYVRTFR